MARLIIMGPPGSGKGTQAEHIAQHFGIPAISTGELFRNHVRNKTELGTEASAYMDRGEFVPDHVTTAMLRARLEEADAGSGFLLDGYPEPSYKSVPWMKCSLTGTKPLKWFWSSPVRLMS